MSEDNRKKRRSYDKEDDDSEANSSHEEESRKRKKSKKKKRQKDERRRSKSRSNRSEGDESDDSSASYRRRKKKHKKEKKQRKRSKEESVKDSAPSPDPQKAQLQTSTDHQSYEQTEQQQTAVQRQVKSQKMVPMSREQYEAQQSQIREVFDPESGRWRLVRGTGEIIERIVSRTDHAAINQRATQDDGSSFARSVYQAAAKR